MTFERRTRAAHTEGSDVHIPQHVVAFPVNHAAWSRLRNEIVQDAEAADRTEARECRKVLGKFGELPILGSVTP